MVQILFYLLAGVIIIATVLAVTEKHAVHAVVYLVTSFFGLAVVFYLLTAPLIAVFEVIIYAGAVMVLFLFVVMMLDRGNPEEAKRPTLMHCLPALVLSGIILACLVLLLLSQPVPGINGTDRSFLGVEDFALTLFRKYGVAIEIISMQLLFAIVGVLYLGRRRKP